MSGGFKVPSFLVVPVSVFEESLKSLGDIDITAELVVSKAQVPVQVQEQIKSFKDSFPAGTTFATRSSAVVEDSAQAAFAGQFETIFNLGSVAHICEGIVRCWASQFSSNIKAYSDKLNISKKIGMAVVVQQQIDSSVAGVAFSRDPTGSSDHVAIEAAFGQGESVVGGALNPDRWLVHKGNIISRHISKKTMKFALGREGELQELQVNDTDAVRPSLTDAQVKEISDLAEKLERERKAPADIEWAIDSKGVLWLLQARDITTLSAEIFHSPGPGTWLYDPVHFPGPLARIVKESFEDGFTRGFIDSANECGSLLAGIQYRIVDGVVFEQLLPRSPDEIPQCFATSAKYLQEKGWLNSLKEWSNVILPRRTAAHQKLLQEDLKTLSHAALLGHIKNVLGELRESFYTHHCKTFAMVTGIGTFLLSGAQLTGASPDTLLQLVGGSSHISRSITHPNVAQEIVEAFKQDGAGREIIENHHKNSSEELQKLLSLKSPAGAVCRKWMQLYGHFVTGSVDGTYPTLQESPDLVLKNLREVLSARGNRRSSKSLENELLEKLSPADREKFRQMLDEVLHLQSWRDERGFYNENQTLGILRLALRELGSRIGLGHKWELLLEASPEEIYSLPELHISANLADQLKKRRLVRQRPTMVPPFLGAPPEAPPDPSGLPPFVRESEMARGIFMQRVLPAPGSVTQPAEDGVIFGLGANPGVVEGHAKVLSSPESLASIKKGDIVIAKATNSTFNNVLPLVSGIVVDFGGTLSHAAVSARELGIPCVVGTTDASRRIPDGARVRVDGTSGKVFLIKHQSPAL